MAKLLRVVPKRFREKMHLLDLLIGNADRHTGNVIKDQTGRWWAVDHGMASPIHRDWVTSGRYTEGFKGEPLPKHIRRILKRANLDNVGDITDSFYKDKRTSVDLVRFMLLKNKWPTRDDIYEIHGIKIERIG